MFFLKLTRFITTKTSEEYYKQIWNEYEDFVLHNVEVVTVENILKNWDTTKAFGINQISSKFLKDGAPVIVIHLANIINLSITLDTIPLKSKEAKIKPLLKKEIKTETKSYRPISLLPIILKVIEKSIRGTSVTNPFHS